MPRVLLAELASTLPLVGLALTVQVVVYPQFARVPSEAFAPYHDAHARLITYVVLPFMLVELFASVRAAWVPEPGISAASAWVGLGLVGLAWAVTGLVAVPLHDRLSQGFDAALLDRLLLANAVRTAAWVLRAGLLFWRVLEIRPTA